jgi:hypothetical protein
VLRANDVWQTVITQFAFYVTGHAEELRSKFVAHTGTKHPVLLAKDTPYDGHSCFETLLVEGMSRRLTCLIEKQLVDKEIRNWLIPDFSTTTDQDVAVASMTMMGAMKKYFTYEANTGCGFPSVTLLGDTEDWKTCGNVSNSSSLAPTAATWLRRLDCWSPSSTASSSRSPLQTPRTSKAFGCKSPTPPAV